MIFYVFVNIQINEKYKHESYGVINYTHLILSQTFEDAERGIDTVFLADEAGNFYLYPNRFVADDYDPRERSWYMNSIENPDQIFWSDPYIDHGIGKNGFVTVVNR
ncbi:MAG: PDC sensor domain-containing protein [Clostridia bacterium]|nr:PDC sensor domain-containing protein [Clostridia bacterium]